MNFPRLLPCLLLAAATAQAQTYPSRVVRLVVPFTAGGSTDIVGRTVGQKLAELWGQPVVVDNRPGGSTVIGTDIAAKAPPDGYTLLVTPAPFAIVPGLIAKLPYDPAKDFEPITLINTTPLVVIVNPGVPALTDLAGGHVDLLFNGLTSAMPLIRSGKARALAVTSITRAGALPDLPTLDELGLKGFQAVAWNGLSAPARTPRDIIARINADVLKVIRSPELTERLKAEGSDPVGNSPEQYNAFLRDEIAKWAKVIRFAGVKGLQ